MSIEFRPFPKKIIKNFSALFERNNKELLYEILPTYTKRLQR